MPSLFFIIELLILLGAILFAIAFMRRAFVANGIDFLVRISGSILSVVLGAALFFLIRECGGNLFFSLALSSLVATFCLVVGVWKMTRFSRRTWSTPLAKKAGLSSFWNRSLNGIMLLLLWLGGLLLTDFTLSLFASIPAGQKIIAQTTIAKNLLDSPTPSLLAKEQTADHTPLVSPTASQTQTSIGNVADQQRLFFQQTKTGFQDFKNRVYHSVGLESVQHEIKLVRRIINLSPEDKVWLVEKDEQLQELIKHPTILRIAENDSLMDRFDRFSNGAINEIILIGFDNDMNQLLEDEEFIQQIRKIDLNEMLRLCDERHRTGS